MTDQEAHEKEPESAVSTRLVERIISGDARAEGEMVERYHRALLVMLKQRSKDPFLADDIAQDTWQKIISKVRDGELRDHTKLGAFIMQVGRNLLTMDYRRRANKEQYSDPAELDIEDKDSNPDRQLSADQTSNCVRQLLGEMNTERDRDILLRFYLQQETKDSICSLYELTDLHFNRVLFRARQRFKELWEAQTTQNM